MLIDSIKKIYSFQRNIKNITKRRGKKLIRIPKTVKILFERFLSFYWEKKTHHIPLLIDSVYQQSIITINFS